ncbi:MAG TPA: A/G-specific adenine glycosylase [Gammaproteobacteria bacterium]|nr:A/G-specific adenine glycosylase [Gammaproteobacteria bacterium]
MRGNNRFSGSLLRWFRKHGRHDLPWQVNPTPYRVWVSEIMLQQTRVSTVIPYFNRFMERFPDVKSLAEATQDEVLHYWSGLGYYARGRNLHRAARVVMQEHRGKLPEGIDALQELPGIGRSTAGAILSLAGSQRQVILDGNVKRVLARYHAVEGWPGKSAVNRELWTLAEKHTPEKQVAAYNQAIMDLGATVCLRRHPDCLSCPLMQACRACRQGNPHDYPGRKPPRQLPVRETVFTVLENAEGELLLEKRPPTGIWGGLWGFPECSPGEDISHWIRHKLGYRPLSITYETPLRHTFSHFHLHIQPVHVTVNSNAAVNESDRYCWYIPQDNRSIGLAAPVKKILQEFGNISGDTVNE